MLLLLLSDVPVEVLDAMGIRLEAPLQFRSQACLAPRIIAVIGIGPRAGVGAGVVPILLRSLVRIILGLYYLHIIIGIIIILGRKSCARELKSHTTKRPRFHTKCY